MSKSATPIDTDRPAPVRMIASYDEYIATYFPALSQQKASQALTPQQFGVSMATDSLARIKETLELKRIP